MFGYVFFVYLTIKWLKTETFKIVCVVFFYGGIVMSLFNSVMGAVSRFVGTSILCVDTYRSINKIYSDLSEKKEFYISDDCRFDDIKNGLSWIYIWVHN